MFDDLGRVAGGSVEDWRAGEGSEEGWRRFGGGLEKVWRRMGRSIFDRCSIDVR